MAVKMHASLIQTAGYRFPDVVQDHAPGEARVCFRFRWQHRQHQQGVLPDVAFGVESRRLFDAAEGVNFGKKFFQEAGCGQKFHPTPGPPAYEQLGDLVTDAFGADPADIFNMSSDGRQDIAVYIITQIGGKAHRPQHPQMILGKALLRGADRADEAAANVLAPAHIINQGSRLGIK
jgi:hypothetical protein